MDKIYVKLFESLSKDRQDKMMFSAIVVAVSILVCCIAGLAAFTMWLLSHA